MTKGYFITGTGTGVGKTVVTAGLLAGFRQRGITAMAMKPVQSGGIGDTRFLIHTGRLPIAQSEINCYSFQPAVSPHLAAEWAGEEISLPVIKQAFNRLAGQYRPVLVEGAGGICVPLTRAGFTVADLAGELGLPLIVVARAGLGTINHTALTVKWAQHLGLTIKGIIINDYNALNPIEADNVFMITRLTDVPVIGLIPPVAGLSVEANRPGSLPEIVDRQINWDYLLTEERKKHDYISG
ncbi:MAG: dethiobiotin synthase [Heliobacteriaceae bacterium]|nr:dethiobiotin synthase [Heliobacteriaceae bacterium]